MTDSLTPEQRSERMSRIRSSNTKPELILRRGLHRLGLRFRLHYAGLPGKPDLVFPKFRTVVFVHGCFWHRHAGCSVASVPKSNTEFWMEKFSKNVARDARNIAELQRLGWRCLIVWECELSQAAARSSTIEAIAQQIRVGPSATP